MTVESVTYISDLDDTYPTGNDAKSEGDNHIRNIKTALLNTFPNVDGPVSVTDAQMNAPVHGTQQSSTSGTYRDFTGIPTWVKRVTVMLAGVSTNGSSPLAIQLGDSGGVETAGYTGGSAYVSNVIDYAAWSTCALIDTVTAASTLLSGAVRIENLTGNTWTIVSNISGAGGATRLASGYKTLSGTLESVRLTTEGGSDTFDAGTINVMYE